MLVPLIANVVEGTRQKGRGTGVFNFQIVGKNEAACAADASREVVERWLPKG